MRGLDVNERQNEIREGMAIVGTILQEIEPSAEYFWISAPLEHSDTGGAAKRDSWLLQMCRAKVEKDLEFPSEYLSDLPGMPERHNGLRATLRRALSSMEMPS